MKNFSCWKHSLLQSSCRESFAKSQGLAIESDLKINNHVSIVHFIVSHAPDIGIFRVTDTQLVKLDVAPLSIKAFIC